LQVGKNLSVSNTKITSLPQGLQVGEMLYLRSTSITSLPPDLKVGRHIWVSAYSSLGKKSDEEIRAMLTTGYIKGEIIR
jgi:hypothetical protein